MKQEEIQGINLDDYVASSGNIKDIFHSQARYFSIEKKKIIYFKTGTDDDGFDIGLMAPSLSVSGARSGAFKLGDKKFNVNIKYAGAVSLYNSLQEKNGTRARYNVREGVITLQQIKSQVREKINEKINLLEQFLLRRLG